MSSEGKGWCKTFPNQHQQTVISCFFLTRYDQLVHVQTYTLHSTLLVAANKIKAAHRSFSQFPTAQSRVDQACYSAQLVWLRVSRVQQKPSTCLSIPRSQEHQINQQFTTEASTFKHFVYHDIRLQSTWLVRKGECFRNNWSLFLLSNISQSTQSQYCEFAYIIGDRLP